MAYAEAWDLVPDFKSGASLRDYLNFSDPGMQMAAYYGRFGAEFPDNEIRSRLNWEPEGRWMEYIEKAARFFIENRNRDSA